MTKSATWPGVLALALCVQHARSQSLSITPVNVLLQPGQKTTTLTVGNQGSVDTAIQIRVYRWAQSGGEDELSEAGSVLVSPPLATIAAGGKQVVRLVLRELPRDQEATYRILIDQIPSPSQAGTVKLLLRSSIPVFVPPPTPVAPHLQFHVEREAAGRLFLVGVNTGRRHESVHDIQLAFANGTVMKAAAAGLPYLLAGATRRWLLTPGDPAVNAKALTLTARTDAGAVEQQIAVVDVP